MTDCTNADVRDMLPDFVAEHLSPVEHAKVATHIATCDVCAEELAVVRAVRALRPRYTPVDVAGIVAQIPRPASMAATNVNSTDRSIVSLDSRRANSQQKRPGVGRAWNTWRIAAAIGVIVVGGGSMVIARNGKVSSVAMLAVDSVATVSGVDGADSLSPSSVERQARPVAAVSFGDVGNYTDDELNQVLARLEQWDGATSTETMSTAPIVPVGRGGSQQ